MSNNTLTHYGILGMRWGVRRSDAQISRTSRRKSSAQEKTSPLKPITKKPRSARDMTDAELRTLVNRLQMERQYSQLSEGKVSKGKQYAQKFMKGATTVATVTTTGLTIYNNVEKIKGVLEKVKK